MGSWAAPPSSQGRYITHGGSGRGGRVLYGSAACPAGGDRDRRRGRFCFARWRYLSRGRRLPGTHVPPGRGRRLPRCRARSTPVKHPPLPDPPAGHVRTSPRAERRFASLAIFEYSTRLANKATRNVSARRRPGHLGPAPGAVEFYPPRASFALFICWIAFRDLKRLRLSSRNLGS